MLTHGFKYITDRKLPKYRYLYMYGLVHVCVSYLFLLRSLEAVTVVMMRLSSAQILLSKHFSPLKELELLGKVVYSRAEIGKYRMSLE